MMRGLCSFQKGLIPTRGWAECLGGRLRFACSPIDRFYTLHDESPEKCSNERHSSGDHEREARASVDLHDQSGDPRGDNP